jgi:hypothetical protein
MLRRIKVRYDALEDRLQLTLQTEAQTHHLLLTRRVWTRARQALQRLLDLSAESPASLPRVVRESISAAHHQAVASQTPATREPAPAPGAPAQAVLVTGLRLGRRKMSSGEPVRRSWVLLFELNDRPDLRLVLDDRTLHALVGALLRREQSTGWSLPALPAQVALVPEDNPTLQ